MAPNPTTAPLKGSSTRWAEHRDFSYGMCRDIPSYAAPLESVYDSVNFLFDQPGRLRKRGGWTTPCAAVSEGPASIGRALNTNLATGGTIYIYDTVANRIKSVDTSAGTETVVGIPIAPNKPAYIGRAAEHLGTVVFPFLKTNDVSVAGSPNVSDVWAYAGSPNGPTTSLAHPASSTVVAGSNKITIGGGDTTSGLIVGQVFSAADATNFYIGIVEGIIDSTHFTVRPTPGVGFTPTSGGWQDYGLPSNGRGGEFAGGAFAASFQNRLVFAKTLTNDITGNFILHPNRVAYSILPDETPSLLPANNTGAYWLDNIGYEDDNYFEVAASAPLSGMAPVGEGQLLFFSPTECFRLTGTLSTQTATSSGVNIDVRKASSSVGCLNDRSISQTQRGIVFGSLDGVYAYDGSQFRPLMNQRIANLWRDYINNSAAIPVGSGIIRGNHYIVTLATTTGVVVDTLICNLDTLAWGRIDNTPITGGVTDPLDASITWASRLNTAGYSGGATRAVVRLDKIFNPSSSNKSDGDAVAVVPTLKTQSYPEGDQNTRKKFRRFQVEYDLRAASGSPTITVAADTKLKVSDASYTTLVTGAGATTIGTTASASSEVTFDVGAKLAKGVAIEYSITQTGASDTTEILGLKHGFQTQREGRSN